MKGMQRILTMLREKGCRITPQRLEILETLRTFAGPFAAGELWCAVQLRDPAIGLDTVYRNLALLTEIGYLLVIGGAGKTGARYEIAADLSHHHHVVCIHCGAARCIEYCPVDDELAQRVENQGYQLLRHQLELLGICDECRRKGGRL